MQEHVHENDLTAEEAAEYLGVELKSLPALLERYGVGRYYEAGYGESFFYERADLDKIKRSIEATRSASPP